MVTSYSTKEVNKLFDLPPRNRHYTRLEDLIPLSLSLSSPYSIPFSFSCLSANIRRRHNTPNTTPPKLNPFFLSLQNKTTILSSSLYRKIPASITVTFLLLNLISNCFDHMMDNKVYCFHEMMSLIEGFVSKQTMSRE
ncbi:hypothetical protein RIF29_21986 [Crotalaria pallida]|uniref:Uncharacterized protein n=1 Tax=Crotalaria pallida TaxID=3830 RepID=A0AAN9F8H4_CROPI